jgi:acyl-CoA thioesterase FadM
MGEGEPMRFVTGSLKVDFLRPTPMGVELVVRAKLLSIEGRKVRMAMTLSAGDVVCATSEMLAIQFKD